MWLSLIVFSLSAVFSAALWFPVAADASTASWSLEPAGWDFGTRLPAEGPTEAKAFELVNTGGVALTPNLISVFNQEGSGFAFANESCHGPLSPGGRCTIDVTFDPHSGGEKEGTLTVETLSPGVTAATAQLSGSGGEPVVKIDPAAVDFGTVPIPVGALPGESARVVTVTNDGSADLSIDELGYEEAAPTSARPNFFATVAPNGCGGATVAPGGSCSLDLEFSPRASGTFHAQIRLADNAADSPQVITLTGMGVPEGLKPPVLDTRAPALPVLTRKPTGPTKARKATFAFSGDAITARFQCGLGSGSPGRWCKSPAHFSRLRPGTHVFSVRAVGGDGIPGPVLRYRWRILP